MNLLNYLNPLSYSYFNYSETKLTNETSIVEEVKPIETLKNQLNDLLLQKQKEVESVAWLAGPARNAESVEQVKTRIEKSKLNSFKCPLGVQVNYSHITQNEIENALAGLRKTPPIEKKIFKKKGVLGEFEEHFNKEGDYKNFLKTLKI